MPYILPEARIALDLDVTRDIESVGELNYMITMGLLEVPRPDLQDYIHLTIATYLIGRTPTYSLYNGVIGACMCALLEHTRRTGHVDDDLTEMMAEVISHFYATLVGPYEDEKIAQNGDIPGYMRLSTPTEESNYAESVSSRSYAGLS